MRLRTSIAIHAAGFLFVFAACDGEDETTSNATTAEHVEGHIVVDGGLIDADVAIGLEPQVWPILSAHCLRCHNQRTDAGGRTSGGFGLGTTPTAAHAALVNALPVSKTCGIDGGLRQIVPFQPELSLFYLKFVDQQPEGCGAMMPPLRDGGATDGEVPSAAEIATVRAWIAAGAKL